MIPKSQDRGVPCEFEFEPSKQHAPCARKRYNNADIELVSLRHNTRTLNVDCLRILCRG